MKFDAGQKRRDGVLIRKFGKSVRYTAIGQGSEDISMFFTNPTRQTQAGNRRVNTTAPQGLVLKSEAPNLRQGDLFRIDGKDYRCKEPGPDEGEVVAVKLENLK